MKFDRCSIVSSPPVAVSELAEIRALAPLDAPMPPSLRVLKKIDRELMSRSEPTRWQAAVVLGEFAVSTPERIWPLVLKHGSRRYADARMAIATCVLEHILEHHFEAFFARVADAARSSRWFADTAGSCWQMGQSELPRNARRWRRLMSELPAKPAMRVSQKT